MVNGNPIFFETSDDFRAWLASHHDSVEEQWVGLWKKATGKPSITWTESVAQALCFGWIDGLRRSIDDEAYMIRFTPRKPKSHWSRRNAAMYRELEVAGLVEAPGRAAWEQRDPENTGQASYERERAVFGDELRAMLDADPAAAAWFDAQPPGYRRTATYWVVSAKRKETRVRRMEQLIQDSAAERKIQPLRR
jgi:uncharacterized protein YdeI (YjbR/CyaY-like superfamily)